MAIEIAASCGTLAESSSSLGISMPFLVILVLFLLLEGVSTFIAIWHTMKKYVEVHDESDHKPKNMNSMSCLTRSGVEEVSIRSSINRSH